MSIDQPPPAPAKPVPAKPVQKNNTVLYILVGLAVALLLCICVVPILLLPAVYQVREAARFTASQNNAKMIGLAVFNYHDANRRLPPPIRHSEDGKELHSWRTELLPFMELDSVNVNKNVAWNEGENSSLINMPIPKFTSPRATHTQPGLTNFVAVVGPETVFPPSGNRVRMDMIPDGSSRTIMFVEYLDSEIPWAKPEDVTPDQAVEIIKSNKSRFGTTVVLCDGSVMAINANVDEATLRAMFTRAGGEVVDGF